MVYCFFCCFVVLDSHFGGSATSSPPGSGSTPTSASLVAKTTTDKTETNVQCYSTTTTTVACNSTTSTFTSTNNSLSSSSPSIDLTNKSTNINKDTDENIETLTNSTNISSEILKNDQSMIGKTVPYHSAYHPHAFLSPIVSTPSVDVGTGGIAYSKLIPSPQPASSAHPLTDNSAVLSPYFYHRYQQLYHHLNQSILTNELHAALVQASSALTPVNTTSVFSLNSVTPTTTATDINKSNLVVVDAHVPVIASTSSYQQTKINNTESNVSSATNDTNELIVNDTITTTSTISTSALTTFEDEGIDMEIDNVTTTATTTTSIASSMDTAAETISTPTTSSSITTTSAAAASLSPSSDKVGEIGFYYQ